MSQTMAQSGGQAVGRQIVLPLSKAVEIAYKSIRLRLSRSLLVTSGIVLALAFLMAIRTGESLLNGMRAWIVRAPTTSEYAALLAERQKLETAIAELEAPLWRATSGNPALPKGVARIDPQKVLGADLPELRKEFGRLPGSPAALAVALSVQPELVETMKQWMSQQRRLRAVRDELTGPERLAAMMEAQGVPTDPVKVADQRLQTRWLLGLALLVAFVGILNAMLMSVTERFREIGTMKCLGALDSFIVKLFLIESLFQGVVGTVIGISIGLALSLASAALTYGGFAFRMVPWGSILASAGLCFIVGVGLTVAGALYPAWQAARMQPVEAMRVEA